jgi:hypothetical protein
MKNAYQGRGCGHVEQTVDHFTGSFFGDFPSPVRAAFASAIKRLACRSDSAM